MQTNVVSLVDELKQLVDKVEKEEPQGLEDVQRVFQTISELESRLEDEIEKQDESRHEESDVLSGLESKLNSIKRKLATELRMLKMKNK